MRVAHTLIKVREPQCLECSHPLPMRALWRFAQLEEKYVPSFGFLNPNGLLKGDVGITCPRCGTDFKVGQTRIRIARITAWLALLLLAGLIGWWRPVGVTGPRGFALAMVMAIGVQALLGYLTPLLATVQPLKHGEIVSFPLKSAYGGGTAGAP